MTFLCQICHFADIFVQVCPLSSHSLKYQLLNSYLHCIFLNTCLYYAVAVIDNMYLGPVFVLCVWFFLTYFLPFKWNTSSTYIYYHY
jgi:hypothetical protein